MPAAHHVLLEKIDFSTISLVVLNKDRGSCAKSPDPLRGRVGSGHETNTFLVQNYSIYITLCWMIFPTINSGLLYCTWETSLVCCCIVTHAGSTRDNRQQIHDLFQNTDIIISIPVLTESRCNSPNQFIPVLTESRCNSPNQYIPVLTESRCNSPNQYIRTCPDWE